MLTQCALCGKLVNPRSFAILGWGICPWMDETLFICPRHLAREKQPDAVHREKWRRVYIRLARRYLVEQVL